MTHLIVVSDDGEDIASEDAILVPLGVDVHGNIGDGHSHPIVGKMTVSVKGRDEVRVANKTSQWLIGLSMSVANMSSQWLTFPSSAPPGSLRGGRG